MKRADESVYREYVVARIESLRRTAYLLCRDWHTADDLTSITIGKLYRHWRRAQRADNLDAYVRGILVHAWLDERRRPWRREHSVDVVLDRADAPGHDVPNACGCSPSWERCRRGGERRSSSASTATSRWSRPPGFSAAAAET